jgi:hypothetical protein
LHSCGSVSVGGEPRFAAPRHPACALMSGFQPAQRWRHGGQSGHYLGHDHSRGDATAGSDLFAGRATPRLTTVVQPCDTAARRPQQRNARYCQPLAAARKHGGQFPTPQKDQLGRKTPMPLNPGSDWRRIGGHEDACFCFRGILPTLPVDPARRVEAQHCLWRHADPITGDTAQH